MKRSILAMVLICICSFGLMAQDMWFYQTGSEHVWINSKISSDQEVSRIDSLVKDVFRDTASFVRKYYTTTNTHYYWKADALVCAVFYSKQQNGTNRTEWVFENGLPVFMKQTVRLPDGKYFSKDRYYFFIEANHIQGGEMSTLFAWTWFGKRVHESSPAFELRKSSLSDQGVKVYKSGIQLREGVH